MPTDLLPIHLLAQHATLLDAFALVWFLGLWVVYTVVQDHIPRVRFGINRHLDTVRVHWMSRMMERDVRIMDSQLVGHTMHSATFFASTTMLVLAGLLGSFGAVEQAHRIIGGLSFTVKTSRELFEVKLLLLVVIFAFGFFKFTWALRQFNYCIALIGAAPNHPVRAEEAAVFAAMISRTMTLAVAALNAGLRSYYFAIAALGWIIHPWLLIVASGGVVAVLVRRQVYSPAERAIAEYARILDRREP